MTWLRLDAASAQHPKIARLAKALGVPRAHAFGLAAGVWCYAMQYAQTGVLPTGDADLVEAWVGWTGEPGALLPALRKAGLVDGANLHDWPEYTAGLREAERKRRYREEVRKKGTDASVRGATDARRLRTNERTNEQDPPPHTRARESDPATPELQEAYRLVALALAGWEGALLPVVSDYVDADRAIGFAQAVRLVAERHGWTTGDVVERTTIAAGASAWCRGETSTNKRPVDSGWLVAPTKKTSYGSRPLPLGEHVERIERLIAGYYDRDHAAERQAPKPKTQAQQAFDELERLEAEDRAKATGPRRGVLRVASGESERRARWVRGGEA